MKLVLTFSVNWHWLSNKLS